MTPDADDTDKKRDSSGICTGYRSTDACRDESPDIGGPGAGFGTTPASPKQPMARPNSLIMALPIKHTQPRPSPVTHWPGQNSSPSSSSMSGSCSSCADRLELIIRANVVG